MTTYVSARREPTVEHRFYFGMAIAIAVTVFAGFARSFFLRPLFADFAAHQTPPEFWFYAHGAIFTAWVVLFLLQASLISTGNETIHRKLGLAALALIPMMVISGVVGVLISVRRPTGFFGVPPAAALQFAATPIFLIAMFSSFACAGIAQRNHPQAHKRFMLLASMCLLEPAVGRLPIDFILNGPGFLPFVLSALYLVPLVVWDLGSQARLHAVTLWGGLAFILSGIVRFSICQTPAWTFAVHWAAGLLG